MAEAQTKEKKRDKSFKDFKGVNTQAVRQSIDDDEFAWLENVMPIGHGNAKTVYAPSAALATVPQNCYYMTSENIGNVNYMFMFCTDGSAYAVNLTTNLFQPAGTYFAPPGTFTGSGTRIAQWKNERIVIIDPNNGYFDWDGTTLTAWQGSVMSVTVAVPGTGFTNATTTTLTASSGSATFSCTLGCNLITIVGAGTNYVVNDVLTVSGGTFTSPVQATVSTVNASTGAITGINLTQTGIYTIYPGAGTLNLTGGHGTSATATFAWGIYAVTVVTPGSGYGSTPPTITIAGAGAGVNAQLTVNLGMSSNGTSIATYEDRVWVASARTVLFSAPDSYSDFTTASLGGSFIMTDDTLHSDIMRLFAANNFLYIFGIDSINVISDVTVTTPVYTSTGTVITPSVTVFSNSDISTGIGTDMPDSIVAYYRTLAFANDYGVYGLTGVTPQKISAELDGVYPLFNNETQLVSGGITSIFNILTLAFLYNYADPMTGTNRNIMAIFFNKKWFFSSQVSGMTFIAPALYNDTPNMYATDGLKLYRLFDNVNESIAQIIRTKLWDMGNPLITKQAFKFGLETLSSASPATFTIDIDTEIGTQTYGAAASNVMIWYNNSDQVITWTNNLSQTITWLASGYDFVRQDVNNVGNYLGATITSSSPGLTYSGLHLQYEPRTPWAGVPW